MYSSDKSLESAISRLKNDDATLTELDLSGNALFQQSSLDFTTRICSAIRDNTHLQKLILRELFISDDGFVLLANSLRSNQYITHLDVSLNRLDKKGITAMANALKGNNTLKILEFAGAVYNVDCFVKSFVEALQENTTLQKLILPSAIPAKDVQVINGLLQKNGGNGQSENTTVTLSLPSGKNPGGNSGQISPRISTSNPSSTSNARSNNLSTNSSTNSKTTPRQSGSYTPTLKSSNTSTPTTTNNNPSPRAAGGTSTQNVPNSQNSANVPTPNVTLTPAGSQGTSPMLSRSPAKTIATPNLTNPSTNSQNQLLPNLGGGGAPPSPRSASDTKWTAIKPATRSKEPQLSILDLKVCKTMEDVQEALESKRRFTIHSCLTEIDLWNKQIGTDCAKLLCDALKGNTTVTQLNLYNNGIGDEGAIALADALSGNSTINKLDLYNNKIGSEGAKALLEFMKENISILEINLDNNTMKESLKDAIYEQERINNDPVRCEDKKKKIATDRKSVV